MNVLVFNGSPKGKNSISLQTVLYLQNRFLQDKFDIIHVGQTIRKLEKDFSGIQERVDSADLILFVYPVYTFLAPSQLHRFVELLKEHQIDFAGKIASQISTSKHFYDTTAHAYIQDISFDLGMKTIKGLSADMDDLLSKQGQQEALNFWKEVHFDFDNQLYHQPFANMESYYRHPEKFKLKMMKSQTLSESPKKDNFTAVILTDVGEDEESETLKNMIIAFQNSFPYQTKVVNLRDFPFQGGCLGCFRCATSGKCVYKDGFDAFLREQIQSCNATVFAFRIKDHSMGSLFKKYDDRNFCNGHRPVMDGASVAYLIDGNLAMEENLRTVIEGRAQVGHTYLAGIATNEVDPEAAVQDVALKLAFGLENKLLYSPNFMGLGGRKIFRDLIYLMQGMMAADHKYYKQKGFYDFPQKKRWYILKMKLIGLFMKNDKMMAKMAGKLNGIIVAPYQKVVHVEKK